MPRIGEAGPGRRTLRYTATPRPCGIVRGPCAFRATDRDTGSRAARASPTPAEIPMSAVDRPSFLPIAQVFASRRIAAMLGLGFASGLPLALSSGTLQAWLTVEGIDIRTIGLFALVGLPYTFKFVWAPLLDRFEPPWLGRRRAWLLITQLLLGAACWAMASFDPRTSIGALAGLAVAVAFLSASQDVVFDAYRTDLLDPQERGAGAAVSVLGYRLAMLVSGGLALIVADQWVGWPNMFRLMGALFVVMAGITLLAPRTPFDGLRLRSDARREWVGFVSMVAAGGLAWVALDALFAAALPERPDRFAKLAADTVTLLAAFGVALWAARRAGFPSFVEPWDAFFTRRRAVSLLALIVLYKLGDAFAGSLSTAFLIRGAGFTPTEVGAVNKVLGLVATIVGALAGGALLARISLYRALMWFGLLQAVSNFGYWLLAVSPKSYPLMTAAIGVENLCGGLGTAAFVAFLMALTDRRFTAAQYALLSALAAVGRVYVGPASGVLVEAFGWPSFFLMTVAAAIPGLLLLYWLRPEIAALDTPAAAPEQEPNR
jgi:PAT family beta-lactamase induction signal transducer AmpG